MSDASANRYQASWLAWPARVLCWPLAAVAWAIGAVVRGVVGLPLAVAHGARGSEGALASALEQLRRFMHRGAEYLTFRSDTFPALWGTVRSADESPGPNWEAKRRLKKSHIAMISTIGVVLYLYIGGLAQAGVIAADYRVDNVDLPYAAPMTVDGYPLGTEVFGRNVLSMTLRGASTALWIGAFAAALSCVLGMVLGALGGYFGGWVDDVIVWLYTTITSIPYLLLLLTFSFAIKNNQALIDWYRESFLQQDLGLTLGLFTIVLAIGLTSWVGTCRIVRSEFIKLRDQEFVQAGRSLGLSHARLIFRHILPNVFHLVLISFSLLFVSAIKFEVILSYLGLGLEPGEASWGNMINEGAQELVRSPSVWWQITAATVALFGLVLFVNLLADALRDALDPRLRK